MCYKELIDIKNNLETIIENTTQGSKGYYIMKGLKIGLKTALAIVEDKLEYLELQEKGGK